MQTKQENTIIFEYDPANPPPLTDKQKLELERLASMPDTDIDYSDIAPQENLEGFYRPHQLSGLVRVDSDILDWIKTLGNDRETLINAILRRQMKAALGE